MKLLYLATLLFIVSCYEKRLNEVIVKDNTIKVSWYLVSEITTAHEFIEVTKGSSTIQIMELSGGGPGIADISIDKDTIAIKSLPSILIYQFADKAFDYKVKLDTSISWEYWQKKAAERDIQFGRTN